MTPREEALRIAEDLRDYRAKSMVEGGRALAHFVLQDEKDRRALIENLSAVQFRCSELLQDRRTLCRLVEQLREADFEDTKKLVAELVTACRGMQ